MLQVLRVAPLQSYIKTLRSLRMIECYYKWCRWHHQDEPFCCEETCIATEEELEAYKNLRAEEFKNDS